MKKNQPAKEVNNKKDLCTMLNDIILVTRLTVKELTEGTASVEQAYEVSINKLALEILHTPISKQKAMKEVFAKYSSYDEEATYKAAYYIGNSYDIAKLSEATNEEIISLLERSERFKTCFAILYSIESGYARNQQMLSFYKWTTSTGFFQVEDEAVKRGLIEKDIEEFNWETI